MDWREAPFRRLDRWLKIHVNQVVIPVYSDWWFETFFIWPYIGKNHPNGLIFFRGVETTNQYSCRFYHTVDYVNLNYIELHPCQKWLCLQIGDPHNLGVSSKLPLAQQVRVSHGIHHFNTQAKFHVDAYITALHYMIYIVLE